MAQKTCANTTGTMKAIPNKFHVKAAVTACSDGQAE
jgi:hypothetical protein